LSAFHSRQKFAIFDESAASFQRQYSIAGEKTASELPATENEPLTTGNLPMKS
jgi:hypothetical protein